MAETQAPSAKKKSADKSADGKGSGDKADINLNDPTLGAEPEAQLKRDPITYQEAIRRFRKVRHNMVPHLSREDSTIQAEIGFYRIAADEDGNKVLLFSFSPESLTGEEPGDKSAKDNEDGQKNKTKGKDKTKGKSTTGKSFSDIYVVKAKTAAAGKDWIYSAMVRHQYKLADAFIRDLKLHKLDRNTYSNRFLAYDIRPDTREPKDEQGRDMFNVRMYAPGERADGFVYEPGGSRNDLLGHAFLPSSDIGTRFTEDEARRFIASDFAKRAQRILRGQHPLSSDDKKQDLSWYWKLAADYVGNRIRKMKVAGMSVEALSAGAAVLASPISGLVWAGERALERLAEYVDKKMEKRKRSPNDITHELVSPHRKLWSDVQRACRSVIGKKLGKYRFLQREEMIDLLPRGMVVRDRNTEKWAREWIFNATNGPPGSIIECIKDSTINIQHANGLSVEYLVSDEGVSKAYLRYKPELKQPGVPPVPPVVEKMLEGSDVVEISEVRRKNGKSYLRTRSITEEQFRQNKQDILRDWRQKEKELVKEARAKAEKGDAGEKPESGTKKGPDKKTKRAKVPAPA